MFGADFMCNGSWFHSEGAALVKDLRPEDLSCHFGTPCHGVVIERRDGVIGRRGGRGRGEPATDRINQILRC